MRTMRTMRTMILALAVILLAATAWAEVIITATHLGDGIVAIDYNAVSESNLPRAFALDITVVEGNIVDINDYERGDDNNGFGIFPGTFYDNITVEDNGTVLSWDVDLYTPLAGPSHPNAQGGLGTNGITIEMGSLYDTNAPGKTGRLCTIKVDSNPAYVSVTLNALSGGVVMEDPNLPVDVNVAGATNVPVITACFPSDYTTYDDWVLYGEPNCWCEPPWGSGYQCDGDADGGTSGFKQYRVYLPDLTLVVDNWEKKIDDLTLNPCADIDHKSSGFKQYRVYLPDLTTVVNSWEMYDVDNLTKPVEERLPGDCPRLE